MQLPFLNRDPAKKNKLDLFFYGLAIIIVVIGLYLFERAKAKDLLFILKPVSSIVSMFYGKSFYFRPSMGFWEPGGVIISKECSGVTFLLVHQCMLVFSFINHFQKIWAKLGGFIIFGLISYLVAIIVNSCRVIGVLYIIKSEHFSDFISRGMTHRLFGAIIYYFFLVFSYFIIKTLFEKAGDRIEKIA